MVTTEQSTAAASARRSFDFLKLLADDFRPRDFAVRFWDGSTWEPDPDQPTRATIEIKHPGALRRMFWPPNGLAFGEAYIFDDFDVTGDMTSVIRFARYLNDMKPSAGRKAKLLWHLFQLPSGGPPRVDDYKRAELTGREHSPERDQAAVDYHYSIPTEFFRLWLDDSMMYTCGYFIRPDDDQDTAHRQKADHICRKLRLRPGERLVDVGCGWGGLVTHAASHYDVDVVGVTINRAQADYARERIRRLGLEGRCRIEIQDYRDTERLGTFDKVSCIGMLEHVGEAMMPSYFQSVWRLLKPGGLLLNQAISCSAVMPAKKWRTFARAYVFPDGDLYPINVPLKYAEAVGFEVRDVESLREHYTLTVSHWLANLEARHEEAVKLTNETTYRVFRLYLAGAQVGFRTGLYNLHQSLLAKPDDGELRLPPTRADLYA